MALLWRSSWMSLVEIQWISIFLVLDLTLCQFSLKESFFFNKSIYVFVYFLLFHGSHSFAYFCDCLIVCIFVCWLPIWFNYRVMLQPEPTLRFFCVSNLVSCSSISEFLWNFELLLKPFCLVSSMHKQFFAILWTILSFFSVHLVLIANCCAALICLWVLVV